jgi:cysteinyl-tRNA synthetase, unknown class
MTDSKNWIYLAVLSLLVFAVTWPYRDYPLRLVAAHKSAGPLTAAKSWHYQLDNIDVDQLAATPADLLVIDYAKFQGKIPLTKEEVARIKAGPDGLGRYVLAYLSVGESEEYRFYWDAAWKAAPPDWLGEENCAWPQAHRVRFWLPGWKDINFRAPDSYLRRIIEAGFDGVYLDRIDIYETYEKERPGARAEMIVYVRELAETAWRIKPGFFIVPQNAEDLLSDQKYRSFVDALGKESLLHGAAATARRNARSDIDWSLEQMNKLRGEGKPVFVVEYLLNSQHIDVTARELRGRSLVPTFQTRALDGKDPTEPIVLKTEVGTPERTTKECPPGSSW